MSDPMSEHGCHNCGFELSCQLAVKETTGWCVRWKSNVGISFIDKIKDALPKEDVISHPKHYTSHPSGVECIQITEHMGFNLGCALKYIWRCDLKRDAIEDLRKAVWYIEREIQKRVAKEKNDE